MNKIAAAKAVGTYLLVVSLLVAWLGGSIWAGVTGQPKVLQLGIGLAPLLLVTVGMALYAAIVRPIVSMYHSFDKAARR